MTLVDEFDELEVYGQRRRQDVGAFVVHTLLIHQTHLLKS